MESNVLRLRVLLWGGSLVFILPLFFSSVHSELAHMRHWQVAWTLLGLPFLIRVLRSHESLVIRSKDLMIPIMCSLIFFFYVALSRYFSIGVNAIDFSIFDTMLLHTSFKNWMYSPVIGASHFGVHQSWTLSLLAPLHSVIRSPWLLFCFGNVILWSAVIPLWALLKKRGFSDVYTVLFCWAYLTNTFVGTVVNSGLRIESFYPVCLFSFLYFWFSKRVFLSALSLLLFLGVKEDAVFYAIPFFLYYSFFQGRRVEAVFCMLISSLFLFLNLKIVQPYFLDTTNPAFLKFWAHYGSSKKEILWGILSSPLKVLKDILTSGWWKVYAFLFFLPFLSVPFTLAALPGIFLLGTASSYPAMHGWGHYYPLVLVCLAFMGLSDIKKSMEKCYALIPWALLIFPLFHVGYATVKPFDWEAYQNLKKAEVFLEGRFQSQEGEKPSEEVCVSAIAFPYLGYSLPLRVWNEECIAKKDNFKLLILGKSPYPHSFSEFREYVDSHKSSLQAQFGSVYIFGRSP